MGIEHLGLGLPSPPQEYPSRSIGFGQRAIKELEGAIGNKDLADVMESLRDLESRRGAFKKVILFGGSHGGFISATLSGKYPDRFAACILRNPVTDLPSFYSSTDILDWPFGQLDLEFDLDHPRPPSREQLIQLQEHSPSVYVKNVKIPTLVLIGERDLRVSPFPGRAWYTWLRSQGVTTKMLVFPDAGHSLDTAVSEKNSLLAINEFLASVG